MASALVLYIDDSPVRPALELLRRICEPASRSAPHITVRAPISNDLPLDALELYRRTRIGAIFVNGPDSFGLSQLAAEQTARSVVYLRCESPLLESLVYKPDFPDNIFHFTIYEGRSPSWGRKVLAVLREFRWGFELQMAPRRLSEITIGAPSSHGDPDGLQLSRSARSLLRSISARRIRPNDIPSLSEAERIELIREVCRTIHADLPVREGENPTSRVQTLEPVGLQQSLWPEPDFHDSDGSTRAALVAQRRAARRNGRDVGLVVTPPELAQDVVDAALKYFDDSAVLDFGDPALGSGIFFATLLRRVKPGRIRSAIGIEVDPLRAEQTSLRWRDSLLQVLEGDLLDAKLDPTRSLVVANPPYVRFQKLDHTTTQKWRARVESLLGMSVDGRADLYVYFVLMTHRWLAPGAISAWLLPSEFLQANYGATLRGYLTTRVELLRVHTYDMTTSKFENARVSSTIVVFRNREPGPTSTAEMSFGGSVDMPAESRRVSARELRQSAKWTSLGLRKSHAEADDADVTLGELFIVRRGIATGANREFIVNDADVLALGIAREWLRPVIPKARELASNTIERDSVGDPLVDPRLWLIDTEEDIGEIRQRAPLFAAYLEGVWTRVGDRALIRHRVPFYRQEQRATPPFFVAYMARSKPRKLRSRFFLNRSEAVVLNNYLCLYTQPHLETLLNSGEVLDTEILDALSAVDEEAIATEGRTYASGLDKIEPRELARVRIRNLPKVVLDSALRHRK